VVIGRDKPTEWFLSLAGLHAGLSTYLLRMHLAHFAMDLFAGLQ
jgi:hypothetical protein